MKVTARFTIAAAAALAAGALAASALAAGTQEPPPAVWPATQTAVFFYLDTVSSGPGEGKVDADKICSQRNFFQRGQRVVFRAAAVETKTGKVLQANDVRYFYLRVPGVRNQALKFARHGRDPATAPWFWTVGWTVPDDYPLGVVDFRLVVRTKAGKTVVWKQAPIDLARLTIVP